MKDSIEYLRKNLLDPKARQDLLLNAKLAKYVEFNSLNEEAHLISLLDKREFSDYTFQFWLKEYQDYGNFHSLRFEIKRAAKEFSNINSVIADFEFGVKEFQTRIDELIAKLEVSIKKDNKITLESAEHGLRDDIATGIFEPDEWAGRQFYNTYINRHISQETRNLNRMINLYVKQVYLFLSVQIEEAIFIPYKFFHDQLPEKLYWKDKFKFLNKNFFNDELVEPCDIFIAANAFKHQTGDTTNFDYKNAISQTRDLLSQIKPLFNLSKIFENIVYMEDYMEMVVNPLGLTGFE